MDDDLSTILLGRHYFLSIPLPSLLIYLRLLSICVRRTHFATTHASRFRFYGYTVPRYFPRICSGPQRPVNDPLRP